MKRTNLVLNEQLLEEAVRVRGERTYSATVDRALFDFVQRIKAQRIIELAGSGLWHGDLSNIRMEICPTLEMITPETDDPGKHVLLVDTSAWIVPG